MMELFQQIINDPRLTSQHVSLIVAILVEQGMSSEPIQVHRGTLMQQGKIKTKDRFFECIHQLHEFEYLKYQRGNRYAPTMVSIILDSRNNATNQIPDSRNNATNQIPDSRNNATNQIPDSRNNVTNQIPDSRNNATSQIPDSRNNATNQIPDLRNNATNQIPDLRNNATNQIPDLRNNATNQIPDLRNLVNQIPDSRNNGIDKLSVYQGIRLFVPKNEPSKPTAPPSPSSSSTYKRSNTIFFNDDVVDAGDDDVVPRARSKKLPTDHPFSESPYFDWLTFQAAFAVGNRYRNVDLRYYYDALCDWRDRDSGLPPLRSDWLRTARVFMRNDAKNHKLALLSQLQPIPPALQNAQPLIINNEKYRRTQ